MAKLNQILAVEKGTKSRVYSEVTTMNASAQKPALFNGFSKNWKPKDEDSEVFPPESLRVQQNAREMLQNLARHLTELFDVSASKDWANCLARADVVVDGKVLLKQSPATYLLFLEKQLNDIQTFVGNLPILDPAEEWRFDEASNVYKSELTKTARTKKVQKPIVLYDATKEHPAQTQLITEDVVIGHWDTVKHSGALPPKRRQELLERVEKLIKAVKFAREEANAQEAEKKDVAAAIFTYLLG
ncbi:MAG: hypothetical protein Q8O67_01335 [Deltaproteobacteria bacterium]|nr:hypothetical protein [Deltaproteobacteria bacterium]